MQLGACARLRLEGTALEVVVSSRAVQAADRAMFEHLGIDLAKTRVLVLKSTYVGSAKKLRVRPASLFLSHPPSSVHFRAHFEPLAVDVLVVISPGMAPMDQSHLAYKRLREGVRRMPRSAKQ